MNKEVRLNLDESLPRDWKVNELNKVADKVTIGLVKTMTTNYVEKGIPLIRNSNIKENYINQESIIYLNEAFALENRNKLLKYGDVVTVHTGDIGTSAVIPKELDGSHGFATLNTSVNSNCIYNHYLSWYFNSWYFKKQALSLSTGDGRNNLNLKDFKTSLICYPKSIEEQQKIASILSSVDKAIEKTEEIIEQTETVEDGLRQELLKKGINHTEFKDSSFGHIPASWKSTFLEEVVDINSDSISSKTDELESINYIDIASIQNNRITGTTEYAFKNAPSRARRKVKTGDIIVSTVRPYLKGFAYITEQYNNSICSTGFSVLRTKQECHSEYLYQIILSNRFVNYLISNMTGSSYPAVKANDIKNYNFPLPPLEEQIKISNILNQSRNKINLEQKKLSELLNIKNGLMQQLLTGKVRVPTTESEEVPQ